MKKDQDKTKEQLITELDKLRQRVTVVEASAVKRNQAEERERQLQQELNLASRLATVGQMASGIAHEINNPLTGVIGFTD